MPQKQRDLYVMTRAEGVRKENPLLTTPNGKYYMPRSVTTPELRKEADELLKQQDKEMSKNISIPKLGMKVVGSKSIKR